jgi:hypothetical protein
MDFIYGEGYSARVRARQAERQAAWEAAERAEQEWRAANPEEAAAKDAAEKKERDEWWEKNKNKRQRQYKPSGREERRWSGSYHVGYAKGDEVGLEPQVGGARPSVRLVGGR